MWCIPKVDSTFIERMEDIIDLYTRPYNLKEPVIGIDEKTFQLLDHLHDPITLRPKHGIRVDYQYKRKGTANIFVGVEPKGGTRLLKVTRTKERVDYLEYLWDIFQKYPEAEHIHAVVDNLSTHSEEEIKKLYDLYPFLRKFIFHLTPVHASWLNVAELEISILERQCLRKKRFPIRELLTTSVSAWENDRNIRKVKIIWKFTKQKAREKFKINRGV